METGTQISTVYSDLAKHLGLTEDKIHNNWKAENGRVYHLTKFGFITSERENQTQMLRKIQNELEEVSEHCVNQKKQLTIKNEQIDELKTQVFTLKSKIANQASHLQTLGGKRDKQKIRAIMIAGKSIEEKLENLKEFLIDKNNFGHPL